jgi:hypothetical protein
MKVLLIAMLLVMFTATACMFPPGPWDRDNGHGQKHDNGHDRGHDRGHDKDRH